MCPLLRSENVEPARPADERVVVPPAGSRSEASRSSRAPVPGLLSARYRAPAARLASDLRIRRTRAARTVPHSLDGRPGPTLLGPRREVGSVARDSGPPDGPDDPGWGLADGRIVHPRRGGLAGVRRPC